MATFSSVTIAARAPGASSAISSPARAMQAVADQDLVGAIAERDLDGFDLRRRRPSPRRGAAQRLEDGVDDRLVRAVGRRRW